MRFLTVRRLALAAVLPVLFCFTFIPGCSKQSEGDRCGDDSGHNDDSDCEDGLICTAIDTGINRCCNPGRVTTSRCVKVTAAAAGAGGAGGAGGAAGANNVSGGGGTGGEASAAAGASNTAGEAGSGGT